MKIMLRFSTAAAMFLTFAASAFSTVTPALGATTPALAAGTVLTVDLGRVLSESAAGKSGATQLSAKYDAQLKQLQATFNTAAQSYQTEVAAARSAGKPGVKPSAATLAAVDQTRERAQVAQNALNQLVQEIQTVDGFVRQQIVAQSGPIAEQIRTERKASLVVPKGAVLASDPAGDVTTVAIQRLDAVFPSPSITLPNPAATPVAVPSS